MVILQHISTELRRIIGIVLQKSNIFLFCMEPNLLDDTAYQVKALIPPCYLKVFHLYNNPIKTPYPR